MKITPEESPLTSQLLQLDISKAKSFDVIEAIKKARIDVNKMVKEPEKAVVFLDGLEEIPVCTLGNISLITGQAKARKTFLVSMITAAAISDRDICAGLRGYLPEGKQNILYFDTEQAEFDAQQAVKKALSLSSEEDPPLFNAYRLREYSTSERIEIINELINNTHNLGFVVIDGVRDLVNDINNATECNDVVAKLMKWSEKKCHITCVLHLNKGNGMARGHLGTELVNKAESVIEVEKPEPDSVYSTVTAKYLRRKGFKPFAIYFNEETHLPDIDHDYEGKSVNKAKKDNGKKLLCHEINDAVHADRIIKMFEYLKPTFGPTYGDNLTSKIIKEKEHLDLFYPDLNRASQNITALPPYLVKIGVLESNEAQETNLNKKRFWISPKAKEMGYKKATGELFPFV